MAAKKKLLSNLSCGGAVCAEKNVKKVSDLPPGLYEQRKQPPSSTGHWIVSKDTRTET
jgi:hypothetical protein